MKFMSSFAIFALGFGASSVSSKPTEHSWPELGVETSIVFPDRSIRNFEADNDDGIWIEDYQRRWYYGAFIGACNRLEHAQTIGFDTRGAAHFDKFSTILVDGDFCQLTSFVTSQKPLPRKERKRLAKEAAEKRKVQRAN